MPPRIRMLRGCGVFHGLWEMSGATMLPRANKGVLIAERPRPAFRLVLKNSRLVFSLEDFFLMVR